MSRQILCLITLCLASSAVAEDEQDAGPSPSDLQIPRPEIRVQVDTGREFRGKLLQPDALRFLVEGGWLTLTSAGLGEVRLADGSGAATVTLRDGSRLGGTLVDPRLTLGIGDGQLHISRSKVRRIAALDAGPARKPAPSLPQPAPERHDLSEPSAPAVLCTEPDVFHGYPGVPTWHPRPVVLRQPFSLWPRVYFAR